MSEKKITDWCATIQDMDYIVRLKPYCGYMVWGYEIGDTGYQHLQTFFQLNTPRPFSWVKDMLQESHFEPRRGTVEEAMQYCMKDGEFEQHGQVKEHQGQGHRSDIEAFVESSKALDRRTMYNKHPTEMVKYARAYDDIQATFALPRPNGSTIYWLFGEPGTGKTSFVKQRYPDHYDKSPADNWWPGYQGQKCVLIDEITTQLPFETLLKIGDPGVLRLPIKGGHTVFGAERLFITSNLLPQNVYPRDFELRAEALLRRCAFYCVKRTGVPLRSVLVRMQFNSFANKFTEVVPYERVEFEVPHVHQLLPI